MTNVKKTSCSKLLQKKKQIPVKVMDSLKSTTQRSKITLNWNQFLAQQNIDVTQTLQKTLQNKNVNCEKNTKPDHSNPKLQTAPGDVRSKKYRRKNMGKFCSAVAIDCEMVGVGDGRDNMLARVSVVDESGHCLYDTFVQPTEPVVDYRTPVSGVRPSDVKNGKDFKTVQNEVFQIIHDKILVGHGIYNDMKVLMLSHPKRHIRDTSKYRRLRAITKGATPSLRALAKAVLNTVIQDGEHSSVEDARTTMQIYLLYKANWESDIRLKHL